VMMMMTVGGRTNRKTANTRVIAGPMAFLDFGPPWTDILSTISQLWK
jgi:hypothetical protein